jgi:hypothetical protein
MGVALLTLLVGETVQALGPLWLAGAAYAVGLAAVLVLVLRDRRLSR